LARLGEAAPPPASPSWLVPNPPARRITLAAPPLPGTGGYPVLDPYRVGRLLARLRPDQIEVSDRLTLRRFGRWATRNRVSRERSRQRV